MGEEKATVSCSHDHNFGGSVGDSSSRNLSHVVLRKIQRQHLLLSIVSDLYCLGIPNFFKRSDIEIACYEERNSEKLVASDRDAACFIAYLRVLLGGYGSGYDQGRYQSYNKHLLFFPYKKIVDCRLIR